MAISASPARPGNCNLRAWVILRVKLPRSAGYAPGAIRGFARLERVSSCNQKLDFAFEDMGEQQVKNITRPVRVYALRSEGIADAPTASATSPASSSPPVAPRLSIVVLPFANLSNDPDQQYFADGITEDLTTDLSRIAHSFVISRNTAFTYRNKSIDTKQVGRELGVRYVLEGSVRRSGNRVRVTAQLIDAETDAHLWAERFDHNTADLLALQDEITSRIAIALNPRNYSQRGCPADRRSRCARLHSPRTCCILETSDAENLQRSNQFVRTRIGARSAIRRGKMPAGWLARGPRHR